MPLFSRKKTEKGKAGALVDPTSTTNPQNGGGGGAQTPQQQAFPAPADPSLAQPGEQGSLHNQSPKRNPVTERSQPATPPKLIFNSFLAHGSPPGKVEGFSNVKELYEKIGEAFAMPADEILFCTLNTFKIDMGKLLGGQIGLTDSIYAHIKGTKFEIAVEKSEAALGLTITDNGAGYAFVKRVREDSVMEKNGYVEVGDHIVMINDREMVGCRHFEVARALKDLKVGEEFTMKLIRPLKAFNEIAPRGKVVSSANNNIRTGKETLRLHSKGPAKVQALAQLDITRDERDKALLAVKKLKDEIDSLKMYYNLHKSLSQEASLRDQFNTTLGSIESQVKNRDEVLARTQLNNSQLAAQVRQANDERNKLVAQLQRSEQEKQQLKHKNQQMERLVSVLRKKVAEGAVKTV